MPDLIDTQAALDDAVALLSQTPALALDTESDAFHAYRPRICLIQISIPGSDLLIDSNADLDFKPPGALLADAGREVVLHAAENDVILLQHQFGWRIGNLFDTQVACFVLGLKPYSLAGVLEARFGVKLDKREQRSDWSRRPLSPTQLEYAIEDTSHLLELAAGLRERARSEGRLEEIQTECLRIAAREWEPEPFDPEGFRRISGATALDPTGLRILRDLFLLRNEEAERRNWAAFRIVPDQALIAIARDRIQRESRMVPKGFWRRYEPRIVGIVKEARKRGPLKARARRRNNRGEPTPPPVKARYERLRRWRSTAAEKRGVESFVVARNELLMKVAEAGPGNLKELEPLLEPFRFREYGASILSVLLETGANRADNAPRS
ncbi:MAG: ribonuclease D [Planctomycetota bacterium]